MTSTHQTRIPLSWLRAAILQCELTLDDTPPPPASSPRTVAPRFTPPSGAGSPEARPLPGTAAERVERLAAACRIPGESILEYLRAHWDSDCASVSSAPPAVLEEIVRAWPDILVEISAARRQRRPACDSGEMLPPSPANPLPDNCEPNLHPSQNGTGIPPVSVATL